MRSLKRELQVVNRAREKLGLAPITEFPKGKPDSRNDCLLAKSLGLRMNCEGGLEGHRVNCRQYVTDLDETQRKALKSLWRTKSPHGWEDSLFLPKLLNDLANEFDREEIPELIEPPAKFEEGAPSA